MDYIINETFQMYDTPLQKLGAKSIEERNMAEILQADFQKPVVMPEQTELTQTPYDNDIKALQNKFGLLREGQIIEITLQDLLCICPRDRRKTDAYKGLVSYCLRAYGTELRVVPNNNRNETLHT